MYELVGAVLTLAGAQYVFAWRFHAIYTGLHEKFSKTVEDAKGRKLKDFGDAFFSFLQLVLEDFNRRKIQLTSLSRQETASISEKSEHMNEISKLAEILESREAIGATYKAARDNARSVYLLSMVSGSLSLLGLWPAVSSGPWNAYMLFVLPLLLVILAFLDYNRAEAKLVKLRDEPLVSG